MKFTSTRSDVEVDSLYTVLRVWRQMEGFLS